LHMATGLIRFSPALAAFPKQHNSCPFLPLLSLSAIPSVHF
jgi:hypothetical protein